MIRAPRRSCYAESARRAAIGAPGVRAVCGMQRGAARFGCSGRALVVGGDAGDDVDAQLLQLGAVAHEAGQVALRGGEAWRAGRVSGSAALRVGAARAFGVRASSARALLQPGVKAPGTAKRMPRLPANMLRTDTCGGGGYPRLRSRAARRARGNGCPRRREARRRPHLRAGAVVGRALRHLHVGQLIAHLGSAQSDGKGARQLGMSCEAKTRQPGRCSAPRCSAARRIVLAVWRGARRERGARRARAAEASGSGAAQRGRALTARHDRRPRAAGRAAARRGANTAGDAHRAAMWKERTRRLTSQAGRTSFTRDFSAAPVLFDACPASRRRQPPRTARGWRCCAMRHCVARAWLPSQLRRAAQRQPRSAAPQPPLRCRHRRRHRRCCGRRTRSRRTRRTTQRIRHRRPSRDLALRR